MPERIQAHDLEGYFEIDARQGFQALGIVNLTTRMQGFSPFLSANLPSRVIDLLPSDLETPQESLDEMSDRAKAEQILQSISEREAYVLGLRYGIGQAEGRSLVEIGQILGVSKQRVKQIEDKAMKSARKAAQQAQLSA